MYGMGGHLPPKAHTAEMQVLLTEKVPQIISCVLCGFVQL